MAESKCPTETLRRNIAAWVRSYSDDDAELIEAMLQWCELHYQLNGDYMPQSFTRSPGIPTLHHWALHGHPLLTGHYQTGKYWRPVPPMEPEPELGAHWDGYTPPEHDELEYCLSDFSTELLDDIRSYLVENGKYFSRLQCYGVAAYYYRGWDYGLAWYGMRGGGQASGIHLSCPQIEWEGWTWPVKTGCISTPYPAPPSYAKGTKPKRPVATPVPPPPTPAPEPSEAQPLLYRKRFAPAPLLPIRHRERPTAPYVPPGGPAFEAHGKATPVSAEGDARSAAAQPATRVSRRR